MKLKIISALLMITVLHNCSENEGLHYVKIKGQKQYVYTLGDGEPVVVFLSGGGSTLEDFDKVQKEISKSTKTISYDKFGLGKSHITNSPRTLENVTGELKELLLIEGLYEKQLLLVGHSMGGYVARYFLHKNPKNVVGMVLIDPGSEHLEAEYRKLQSEEQIRLEDSLLESN